MRAAGYMASIRRSYTSALAELRRLQIARHVSAGAGLSPLLDAQISPLAALDDSNPMDVTRQ